MTKEKILQQCIINTLVLKALTPKSSRTDGYDQLLESLQSWIEELRGDVAIPGSWQHDYENNRVHILSKSTK